MFVSLFRKYGPVYFTFVCCIVVASQVWDDVVRKEKPKEEVFEYKKRLTLDHEKSKLSLAEVYEQEYIKQTQVSPVHSCVSHFTSCSYFCIGIKTF